MIFFRFVPDVSPVNSLTVISSRFLLPTFASRSCSPMLLTSPSSSTMSSSTRCCHHHHIITVVFYIILKGPCPPPLLPHHGRLQGWQRKGDEKVSSSFFSPPSPKVTCKFQIKNTQVGIRDTLLLPGPVCPPPAAQPRLLHSDAHRHHARRRSC